MNRDGYLTVAVALCCIAAVGVSATTLTTSLQQEPDQAVDIDYSKLPLGQDEGKSIRGAVKNEEGDPPAGSSEGDREDPQGGSAAEQGDQEAMDGGGSEGSESDQDGSQGDAGGEAGQQSAGGGNGLESAGTGPAGEGGGTGPLSPIEQLWELIAGLLPWLLLLLLAGLAYRYRRRLLALGLVLRVAFSGGGDDRETTRASWPSEPPANEVHRAWLAMVDRLDLDRPHTRTPSECAAAALDADMDPTAVQTLTAVFEEVRYGERPVTDERRQRAWEGLDRLGGGEGA